MGHFGVKKGEWGILGVNWGGNGFFGGELGWQWVILGLIGLK